MSEELPNREQAIQLLIANNCPPQVINHCLAVTDLAVEIAGKLRKKGVDINLQLVEAGAMLHDLGRSRTHTVDHALVGAQIAQTIGLPELIIRIIKRHVGAGITPKEAQWLGWPKDIYMPQSLEEKVVCYADKRIGSTNRQPIDTEIERLQREDRAEAAERVRRLHELITNMLGDIP